MNMQQTGTESPRRSKLKNSTDTCLQGRWLVVARMLWIALVAFALSIFFVSLPILYAQLKNVCVGNECLAEQLTPETLRVLHDLGLTASTYAIISFVLIVAEAMVWFIVSGVLAWRKSNDWFVLLVALMLVLLSTNNVMNLLATSHSLWQLPAQLCHFLSLVMLFLVFSLFPNGRFVSRWMVWLLVIWIAFQSLNIFFPDKSWGVNNWKAHYRHTPPLLPAGTCTSERVLSDFGGEMPTPIAPSFLMYEHNGKKSLIQVVA